LPSSPAQPATISIPKLEADLDGRVIGPDDPSYDEARMIFSGAFDRRPAAIARVAGAADVASVIALARETGLELAVRSGGHSGAGHSTSEGGIVLDLSDMTGLEIDAEGRTTWAETGLTAGQYTATAGAHGLATGFGDAGSVGIGGITVAGGVGFLARRYGLTIDQVLAAEVVTADGELLRTDAETHPDLFWAIRGGGGNFGVVTRFRYRLYEVGTVVGGTLILPATPDVIAGFVARAEEAPEELSTIANVMPAPPLPFVPSEHHGQLVVMATLVHAGAAEAGERAIAPFRELATPIADMVRPLPYPDMYPPEPEGFHPVATSRTMFVDGIDRDAAETILDHLHTATAPMAAAQLRVLGGAVARVPADATAFAHRERRVMVNLAAIHPSPEEGMDDEPWVTDFAAALRDGGVGAYVGFLGDEGEARVGDAYPQPTRERLAAIKARYDPTNVFRLNQNIRPANDGGVRHQTDA
jgi:FAD/FMN-containing dehydrogenase